MQLLRLQQEGMQQEGVPMASEEFELKLKLQKLQDQRRQLSARNRRLRRQYFTRQGGQLVKPSTLIGAGLTGAVAYAVLRVSASDRRRSMIYLGTPWARLLLEVRLLAVELLDRQMQRLSYRAWARIKQYSAKKE